MAQKAKKLPEDQALEEEFVRPPRDWLQYPRSKIIIVVVVAVALAVLTSLLWPVDPTKNFLPGADHVNRFGAGAIVGATFTVIALLVYFVAKRTLWDLLQLLIVPIALAGIGFFFTMQQDVRQQKIEDRRVQQAQEIENERAKQAQEIEELRAEHATLQAYLDQMGTLLLDRNLRGADETSNVGRLARARTLVVLDALESERQERVLRFLVETELIQTISLKYARLENIELPHRILLRGVDLQQAELKGANLAYADLRGTYLAGAHLEDAHLKEARLEEANLSGAFLERANLSEAHLANVDLSNAAELWKHSTDLMQERGAGLGHANLSGADLRDANLSSASLESANLEGANLEGANLESANLESANLKGANVTDEQLDQAKSLKGATMPNGQTYEEWHKSKGGGDKEVNRTSWIISYEEWLKSKGRGEENSGSS